MGELTLGWKGGVGERRRGVGPKSGCASGDMGVLWTLLLPEGIMTHKELGCTVCWSSESFSEF